MPKLTKKLYGLTDGLMDGRSNGLTDPNYRKAALFKN